MKSTRARSQDAFARACRVIPGGVNSPARAFGAVGGQPLFIARGEGPYLYDLDGNQYLDYVGSWGPLILGHAHPRVVHAVEEAVRRGASFGAPTEAETQLAELIIDAVPSIEMVRMVSSGTEAAMSAIRLARGFTGRDVIVKFAGCYHGHVDSLLVAGRLQRHDARRAQQSRRAERLHRRHARVALQRRAGAGRRLQGARRPDRRRHRRTGRRQHGPGHAVAGVSRRSCAVSPKKHGALLIYDEVMTGFRLAYGGAQQLLRQMPDLTVLGKIVGGGLPVGAYGGRADVMKQVMPAGPVFQAGTLSGNPVAMAAGIATLQELRDHPPYSRLEALATKLADGLSKAATRRESAALSQPRRQHVDAVLHAGAGHGLRQRQDERHGPLRAASSGR